MKIFFGIILLIIWSAIGYSLYWGNQKTQEIHAEKEQFEPYCHMLSERIFANGFDERMFLAMSLETFQVTYKQETDKRSAMHEAFGKAGKYVKTISLYQYHRALQEEAKGSVRQLSCKTAFEHNEAIISYVLKEKEGIYYIIGFNFLFEK